MTNYRKVADDLLSKKLSEEELRKKFLALERWDVRFVSLDGGPSN